jgi:hypothetical protein
LGDEQRHVVLLAEPACALVAIERTGEIVQADKAHGHIAQDHGHVFPILMMVKSVAGALVVVHGFFEAILAMENISDVIFESGDAAGFAEALEDFAGAAGSFEGFIVFPKQNERLDGTAESARGFFPNAKSLVHLDSLFMMLDSGAIVSAGVESVGFGARAESDVFFAAQFAADLDSGFGQVQGFFCVYADLFED